MKNLIVYAYHGVTDEEQKLGRQFRISITAHLQDGTITDSDELADTIDYTRLTDIAYRLLTGTKYRLIETVALKIADAVMTESTLVSEVTVKLEKLCPPVGRVVESTGVEITRKQNSIN